jgi:hypothetical protein
MFAQLNLFFDFLVDDLFVLESIEAIVDLAVVDLALVDLALVLVDFVVVAFTVVDLLDFPRSDSCMVFRINETTVSLVTTRFRLSKTSWGSPSILKAFTNSPARIGKSETISWTKARLRLEELIFIIIIFLF